MYHGFPDPTLQEQGFPAGWFDVSILRGILFALILTFRPDFLGDGVEVLADFPADAREGFSSYEGFPDAGPAIQAHDTFMTSLARLPMVNWAFPHESTKGWNPVFHHRGSG